MLESLFFEIGAIIVLASVLSFMAYALRQPLILAYIVTGMLAGASVLGLATNLEAFEALSQIGIAFLLFTVGLGLDWRKMRDIGGTSLLVGCAQVVFTAAVTYPVALSLGFDTYTSLFLSAAFSFSSTVIIVKLLADKGDLDTLYGRLSLGILLVQDVLAMLLLLVLGAVQSGDTLGTILAVSVFKGAVAILILAATSVWIIPHVVRYAARSQELLLLFAIGWCFFVAGVLTVSGFGIEIGALLAGVSLSGTVFHREILSRVRHLRDFFLIIFFIVLGTSLDPTTFAGLLLPAAIFSALIFFGKPVLTLILLRALGHHPRTGWLTGSTLAQISEFSFIVLAVGVSIGLVEKEAIVLAAAVGLVTIAGSAYLIQFNESVYKLLRPLLRWAEPRVARRRKKTPKPAEVVLIGCHRMGAILLPGLQKLGRRMAVIDYNPSAIDELRTMKVPVYYGDAGDEDFLADAQVHSAKLIVSTVPDLSVTTSLLKYLRGSEYRGIVIVTTKDAREAEHAYDLGATYVIVAPVLGGEKFVELLQKHKLVKKHWKLFENPMLP
ncbi:TPA: hypothetical protein DDZ10_04060 [Candidatus Uhrbacteria bacterium]|nr:MAG: hypothetical protein A3D69_02815 [Candidatus Uhrbacteria bacterium RIFCSPHIGHO2_02_FULL_54_11]HBL39814.1 hypothetical protein [Candidatus Uhrbacteria bacterium]